MASAIVVHQFAPVVYLLIFAHLVWQVITIVMDHVCNVQPIAQIAQTQAIALHARQAII